MREGCQSAFAFVSDIHGNQVALDAVLEDVQRMRAHAAPETFEIICLGDSFDGGPDPLQVYRTLQELGCIQIRGNHEDYLIDCYAHPTAEKYTRPLWRFVPWTILQLSDVVVDVGRSLVERWDSNRWNLHAVHAGVSNNNRVPDFFSLQSELSSVFVAEHRLSSPKSLYFNGHSHHLGRHNHPSNGEVWFNCGSVGYPFVEKIPEHPDAPLATWVWVECRSDNDIQVINRRVPYSSDRLLQRYIESGALELCAPFSFAILAQSLFNKDVVYPFFQQVKKHHLTPRETAFLLVRELENQAIFERINALLQRAGMREIKCEI